MLAKIRPEVPLEVELGDLALGVFVYLSGQKFEDYSLDPNFIPEAHLQGTNPLFAVKVLDRDKALSQWQNWAEAE